MLVLKQLGQVTLKVHVHLFTLFMCFISFFGLEGVFFFVCVFLLVFFYCCCFFVYCCCFLYGCYLHYHCIIFGGGGWRVLELETTTTYICGDFICSRNRLKELPECVTYLRNLKSLHVEYNEVGCVSDRIGKLDKLEDLVSVQLRSENVPADT